MHGICQIVEKMLCQQKCNYGPLGKAVKICITFLIVNFAWIFFRMPTLTDGWGVIERIFDPTKGFTLYSPGGAATFYMTVAVCLLTVKEIVEEFFGSKWLPYNSPSSVIRWMAYLITIITILLCGVFSSDQFIYANF